MNVVTINKEDDKRCVRYSDRMAGLNWWNIHLKTWYITRVETNNGLHVLKK